MMHPSTRHFWELDRKSLWHPYTRHSALRGEPFPIIERGEGVYLFDTDGKRYLDAIASWWACNLGHSHPRLVEAIRRQAAELQHSILGNLSHPRAVELAARIVDLFPGERRRVLFASDGASAVEAALRIAVQYRYNTGEPDRCRFAAFAEGYHGDTLGAMSVGFMPAFHEPFRQLLTPAHQAEAPGCFPCRYGKQPHGCDVECFGSMEHILKEHSGELTAVIVEPLCQGAAGMRIYSPSYLARLGKMCRERGVLLISDEIAMGFGRTGKMFAFEHADPDPDIVCLGKALSGGCLPISAVVVKEEIFATFADEPEDHTFYHGHTFAGNPIAAAAAIECLEIYREENIVQRAERLGQVLRKELAAFHDLPGIANVRCLGMVGAFDLCDGPDETGAQRAQRLRQSLMRRGILIRPLGCSAYLMLPLVVTEDVLVDAVGIIREEIGAL